MKDCLQQRKVQKAVTIAARIEVPVLGVRQAKMPTPSAISAALPSAKEKKTETEPQSRVTSSKPSSRKQDNKKKAKEPMLEEEEDEESMAEDIKSSEGDVGSVKEPSTPPLEPTARMGLCSIDKKKPPPVYKFSSRSKTTHEDPSERRRFQLEAEGEISKE